jgi:cysteine desulfurase
MLESLLHGAGHECGLRAGTENVPYIVGLGRAAAFAARHLDSATERMEMLRDRLQDRLSEGAGASLTVNAVEAERLPNTLSVNFPGVTGGDLLRRCPEICASTGAACHSGSTRLSGTLAAMGLPLEVARGTVRLSLGWYTTEEEVERAAELLIAAWEDLQ